MFGQIVLIIFIVVFVVPTFIILDRSMRDRRAAQRHLDLGRTKIDRWFRHDHEPSRHPPPPAE